MATENKSKTKTYVPKTKTKPSYLLILNTNEPFYGQERKTQITLNNEHTSQSHFHFAGESRLKLSTQDTVPW